MKMLISLAFCWTVCVQSSNGENGLFIPTGPETTAFKEGFLVKKTPVKKVPIKHVLLRPDSEEPKEYWLILHLDAFLEPGDPFFFLMDDEENHGFEVWSMTVEKGSKWALPVKLENGRSILERLAASYDLKPSSAIDKTIEGSEGGQKAPR